MGKDKKEHGTIGLMILTVIIIFCVIAIIVCGFRMIKKNEDAKLAVASDTEYIENKQDREELERQEEAESTEKDLKSQTDSEAQNSDNTKSDSKSQMDADKQESKETENKKTDESDGTFQTEAESNMTVSSDFDGEVDAENSEDEKVYLIKGDEKSSNRYEKADHLSYTTTIKYTAQDLSLLDSYGLKITRNEIYARHGRMFNDQELQEYFQRQKWYVPQTASNDFDSSCLNEVEKYNIELILTYEQQVGGR